MTDLRDTAKRIRRQVLDMIYRGKTSHVGTAFSCVEILTALYFSVLRIDPANPKDPGRDRCILSKGHAAAALYATLAERGVFDAKVLESYCLDGSLLAGHVVLDCVPGAESSGGSGGHGLSLGIGMALAARQDGLGARVFVVMGDGEMEEGSVWEAIMFAAFHKISNLTLIVDKNNLQIMGPTREVLDLDPLDAKLQAFGWDVRSVNGHDIDAVIGALRAPAAGPTAIVASTVKGKGVSFMENRPEWHGKVPNDEEFAKAVAEIEGQDHR